MKYQKQLVPDHDPEAGQIGDCFRTCVAALLDLDAADVPNFMERDGRVNDDWGADLRDWLRPRGLYYLECEFAEVPGLCVVVGDSPRGPYLHCCVYDGAEMVMDPHYEGGGLLSLDRVGILVQIDPGKEGER